MIRQTLGVLVLLGSLVACGEPSATDPGSPNASADYEGTWELVEGRGPDGKVPVIPGYRITLTLEGNEVSGTSACNHYGGAARIEDGSFDVPGVGGTEMACRNDVMQAETSYVAALTAADTISRKNDSLILSGPGTELRFERQEPAPTSELVDTRWKLDGLIYGESSDAVVASPTAPAYLTLKSNGTATGSTGCRRLTGEWTENGDEIAMSTFGAKGACSERLREQDGQIVGVLGDGFTVEIDGDRLTISARGGAGLVYRAAD